MNSQSRLALLHGSNGAAAEMAPLADLLSDFQPFVPNLLGHGGRPVPEALLFSDMVEDLASQLRSAGAAPWHLVGYSFGACVALGVALRRPELVRSVTAIALRVRWPPEAIRHVVYLANPDRLARPGNPRQGQMAEAHGADRWRKVSLNNRAMFSSFAKGAPITDGELRQVAAPTLILSGEADPLAPAAEARYLAATLPKARLGLWPGGAHPLRNVPLRQVARTVTRFVEEVETARAKPRGSEGRQSTLVRRPGIVDGGRPPNSHGIRTRIGGSRRSD